MNIITITLLLIITFLINPIKDLEEKIVTTPFLTLSYIIILSYVLCALNIPLYKWIYILILIPFLIYRLRTFNLDNFKNFKINLSNEFKILYVFLIIIAIFYYLTWIPFPKAYVDVTFHAYKIKHLIDGNYILGIRNYPSGFYIFIYILSDKASDILENIAYFRVIFLILIALSYYYLGSVFNKKLGLFMGIFALSLVEFYVYSIEEIYPNFFGFLFFIYAISFIYKYLKTNEKIHLFYTSLSIISMSFTHLFPLCMFLFFILSLSILKFKKEYLAIIFITILSLGFSYTIYSSIGNSERIISSAKTIHYDKKISYSDIITTTVECFGNSPPFINILEDSYKNFKIYAKILKILMIFYIFLFIIGFIYSINERYYFPFILTTLLTIFWIFNVKIGIYIPYFSYLYDLRRGIDNLSILLPIFYGIGLFAIYRIKKPLKNVLLIASIVLIILTLSIDYSLIKESENVFIAISNDDFKAYNWINENNITNKTFFSLYIWADGSQYIPIYTKNNLIYSYINLTFFDRYGYAMKYWSDNYNYKNFIKICKKYNISYIYLSYGRKLPPYFEDVEKDIKPNKNFFENKTYFQKVYESGTVTIYKIK
ncbi:MAG: hypothetical protein GXN95_02305 [Methanococci archaeon]|nr:hypothetical protein [Methanococci archaeon]